MSKIETLRGPTSPKTFAGILVEHADEIEDVVCVIRWKDDPHKGYTGVYSTKMQMTDATWLAYVFNCQFPETSNMDPRSPNPHDDLVID